MIKWEEQDIETFTKMGMITLNKSQFRGAIEYQLEL